MATERNMVVCYQCHREVERGNLERHLDEECNKVDKQHTADYTPNRPSVSKDGKLELFEKKIEEQYQQFE